MGNNNVGGGIELMTEANKAKKTKPILGGVLSGGKSSRMGRPKDRIKLADGRFMIQHVIDVLLSVCNEVIVAGPELPLTIEENDRVKFVKDNYGGSGPLSGVEAILSTGQSRGYLIAACDQPLITDKILRMLIPEDRDIPCFFDRSAEGFIEPFPGYYPVSWISEIRDSLRRNRRALRSLISESDVILKEADNFVLSRLQSINTEDELALLLGRMSRD